MATMTLLVYATSTQASDNTDGGLFERVTNALDRRYPLCFNVVATRSAAQGIQVSERRDWVTLPTDDGIWSEPDKVAAQMLLRYAAQFRPRATIFIGSDAAAVKAACVEQRRSEGIFGEEVVLTSMDAPLQPLFDLLDRILPASLLVSNASPMDNTAQLISQHPPGAGVALYWDGPFTEQAVTVTQVVQQHATGPVSMQLTLRDVASNVASSFWTVLALRKRHVRVSIVGEVGIARTAGHALTNILKALSPHDTQ
jgi:hypothetical protein